MNVDPSTAGRARRERVGAQERVSRHHLPPGGKVPVDVAVGDGPERHQERTDEDAGIDPNRRSCATGAQARRYFQGNQLLVCINMTTREAQVLWPCMSKW